MLFKHILSIYGSFKHMSEMLKSEPTHYMEEEEEGCHVQVFKVSNTV